jgi:RNA polymerase sigma factor (sigma-70 family)
MVLNRASHIYSMFGSNPELEYVDLVQEIWIVYFNCRRTYTPKRGTFSTYFYNAVAYEATRIFAKAVAHGTYHRWKAAKHLKLRAATDIENLRLQFNVTDAPTPDAASLEAEEKVVAEQILNRLPQKLRVMLLARAEGLTWAEISTQYGISRYWGLKTLRDALDEELRRCFDSD